MKHPIIIMPTENEHMAKIVSKHFEIRFPYIYNVKLLLKNIEEMEEETEKHIKEYTIPKLAGKCEVCMDD